MGKEFAEPVIDLDFAGLSAPQATFKMGRDDITEGRPGDILVGAVRDAKANGVFAALQADRDSQIGQDRKVDTKIGRRTFESKEIASHLVDGPAKEITADNKD
jgi:hypothetical protein